MRARERSHSASTCTASPKIFNSVSLLSNHHLLLKSMGNKNWLDQHAGIELIWSSTSPAGYMGRKISSISYQKLWAEARNRRAAPFLQASAKDCFLLLPSQLSPYARAGPTHRCSRSRLRRRICLWWSPLTWKTWLESQTRESANGTVYLSFFR